MNHFKSAILILVIGITVAFFWGGLSALVSVSILSIMEISLSFDNAILNFTVLKKMDPIWQKRFLTWGIFSSVFLVRIIFPILFVSLVTKVSLPEILKLAFNNPESYTFYLKQAEPALYSFGGIFLLMVFLSFLFDLNRTSYWLGGVEKKINQLGRFRSTVIILTLLTLIILQNIAPTNRGLAVISAGSIAIMAFLLLHNFTGFLMRENLNTVKNGLLPFLYLEMLDASASLDGILSSFAITKDLVIIFLGLGIGAVFVRSFTVHMIEKNLPQRYIFITHGAHYAIGTLGILMLTNIVTPVNELIMGLIGSGIIVAAFFSSLLYNRKAS